MTGSLLPISRRSTLAGLGVASLPVAWASPVAGQAASPFRHGVASGDPDATSVVLWTRVSLPASVASAPVAIEPVTVEWHISADPGFSTLAGSGEITTGPDSDFTVKVIASGLTAGATYHYRFRVNGAVSPAGRTRTLPQGRLDRLGIALASCSNHAFGFFNAYDAIARDPTVDFVLHTGDYIYEYSATEWGGDVARRLGRVHQPAHEIVSLADYRERHAQYKADPDAQAMHAAHPFLACWDDHESANNPWIGGAQNHQGDKEGDWPSRRAAALQAYYEWMPIREPAPGRTRAQFWRSYVFGDLATLFTLETRHSARARQIDYLEHQKALETRADADRFVHEVIDAPGRNMLAQELETDLDAALRQSVAMHQPWRLIGNPMPIARTRVPDVVGLGLMPDPFKVAGSSDDAKQLAWKGARNLPFYPDTWDGYGWARERLYDLARNAGASDLVFLTGDSHSFWANRLADGQGRSAGIELGTAGITSPGDFISSGFGETLSRKLDRTFEAHNPEVVWTDNMHQGYVRLNLTRSGGTVTFIAVNTLEARQYRPSILKRFALRRRGEALEMRERRN